MSKFNLNILKNNKVIAAGVAALTLTGGVAGFAMTQANSVQSQVDMTQYVQTTDFNNYKAANDKLIQDLQAKVSDLETKEVQVNTTGTQAPAATNSSTTPSASPAKSVGTTNTSASTSANTTTSTPTYDNAFYQNQLGDLGYVCSTITPNGVPKTTCNNYSKKIAFQIGYNTGTKQFGIITSYNFKQGYKMWWNNMEELKAFLANE